MSSRALRKLQRELEQQQRQAVLKENEEESEESEEDDYSVATKKGSTLQKNNAFDLLNEASDTEMAPEDEEDSASVESRSDRKPARTVTQAENIDPTSKNEHKSHAKRRPKKAKRKQQPNNNRDGSNQDPNPKPDTGKAKLDEIDLALLSLKESNAEPKDRTDDRPDERFQRLYELLATDIKYLNALNEMRRLFGGAVLESESGNARVQDTGRRHRGPHQLDLGGALAGRNNPVSRGRGLAGLALRRNIFMLGKEEWPKATSGGLGMEIVEKAWDLTTEYCFVHNPTYRDVQRQFSICVESLDPERMVQLLQFNPYHISTLLQVSEIAKQQGDHSVSGDLLERALFSFGRSVHSSFHTALAEGKARLDFRRPENREFWLAAWRYIGSLGQRGTWRTAYEWAKLLLSLDPEEDPYCITLILDQLAIRGNQAEHYIKLAETRATLFENGRHPPNVQITLAIAQFKMNRAKECRETLHVAVREYPWIFERLFKELNIDHLPRSVWGKAPRTAHEKLECEAYVIRAKDIWNTPELISLLVEVAETTDGEPLLPLTDKSISPNEARHTMLSNIPSLISILPRSFTAKHTSAFDPVPPSENLLSYGFDEEDEPSQTPGDPQHPTAADALSLDEPAEHETASPEFTGLQGLLAYLIPWLGRRSQVPEGDGAQLDQHGLERLLEDSGMEPDILEEALELQHDLQAHRIPDMNLDSDEAELEEGLVHEPVSESYSEEQNQRWLLGQGMLRLKDFVNEHGTDEGAWSGDGNIDISPVTEYTRRIFLLENRNRNLILEHLLPQGTNRDVRNLVMRFMETESRGSEG